MQHLMLQITHCFLAGLLLCASPYVAISKGLGLFNEQPKNTTAQEGTNASFYCSINNPNHTLLWLANNTDVTYSRIEERGIRHISINKTSAKLVVPASLSNNNTYVTCLAVPFNPLLSSRSETALLVVEPVPDGTHWDTPNSGKTEAVKKEHSTSPTVTPTTTTTPHNTISIYAASTRSPTPLTDGNTSSSDDSLPGWAVPVIAAVCIGIFIVLIIITIFACIVWFKEKSQKKTVLSNGIPQEALRKESSIDSANTGPHLGEEYSNGTVTLANFNIS